MQTGSAFILMASFFGAVPSNETLPFTLPAFAVSTFWPPAAAGAAAGVPAVLAGSELPPPHAATDAASAMPRTPTQAFRRRIRPLLKKDVSENNSLFYLFFPLRCRCACGLAADRAGGAVP